MINLKKLSRVVWIDSKSFDDWIEYDDIILECATVISVGHIVRENDLMICLAQSVCKETSQCCGLLFIPKICLIEIKDFYRNTLKECEYCGYVPRGCGG